MKIALMVLLSLSVMTGCSAMGGHSKNAVKYSEMRGTFAGKVVDRKLSKQQINEALSKGDSANALRMVEVFHRAEESDPTAPPMYRLFEIQRGSIFDVMGLQNADVLLAANDYIVYDQNGFRIFASQILPHMEMGSVSTVYVNRAGVPLELHYTIVD